MFCDP